MTSNKQFDVAIIGGSYAGLSAAMALGRSLRQVLVIDSGYPCNRQTPHSHNFLTQDGNTPAEISSKAKSQVKKYESVQFVNGLASTVNRENDRFHIMLNSGETFVADKILFSGGLKDQLPDIEGFSDCWGISVLHCPYCHGYEVKKQKTGLLANGDAGFDLAKLLSNWTDDLTLYTNGQAQLTEEQAGKLAEHKIQVVEKQIDRFEHKDGYLERLVFKDGSGHDLQTLYSKISFQQHCAIPQQMGC